MDNHEWKKLKIRLAKSKFRSSIKLNKIDREYFLNIGEKKIREHAQNFIRERLAPTEPKNDGKQTPFHGHPVFVA